MTSPLNVAVLVGSLRKDAYSRKIAHVLMEMAPTVLDCRIVEIADLPLYTEDLDSAPPAPWTRFRAEIQGADAVLIVTPEYNRSVPGGLKNAIDVGSRPPYHSVWDGLPTAVVSVSPYKLGGFGANHHVRQSLVFLNMPVMQQPEAYLPEVTGILNEHGTLVSPDSREFLSKVISGFAAWAQTLGAARPRKST